MKPTPTPSSSDLAALLQSGGPARRSKRLLWVAALVAIVLIGSVWWLRQRNVERNRPSTYVTQRIERGDVNLTITATGNLEPTNEVTVGSELSGTTLEVYVDTNDTVTKGQPLAKLDTSKLSQQTESSRAAVRSAQAKISQAEATLKEVQATLSRQQELNRLSGGKAPSRADLDAAEAAVYRAQADVASAEAALGEAKAQLAINESDLGKAIIKSPIDGIVLTRSLEPGQTVAASFTAPELFVIAENLRHMKLTVTVAEADIANVAKGQKANFTVDAWPERAYSASVVKVAYGSSVSDNVVTYKTELEVANDDLSLRPGMTATADIRVAESKDVFFVPPTALRFDPGTTTAGAPAPGSGGAQKKSFVQSLMPMPPRMSNRPGKNDEAKPAGKPGMGRIWVLRDGQPVPIDVKTGLSDGRRTEVSGEGLSEGMSIIIRTNGSSA